MRREAWSVISLAILLMTEEAATLAAATVWLTKREAAQHARVTVRTITNWISRGLLPAGGTPGKVLIKLHELEHMLEHHRDGHGPDTEG